MKVQLIYEINNKNRCYNILCVKSLPYSKSTIRSTSINGFRFDIK